MNDLLLDVINYIIAQGCATKKDVDIFKDYSPDSPDECVIIYEYNGSAPAPFTEVSVRSIQIVVRGFKSQACKALSWKIFKTLHPENKMMNIGTRKCIIANRNTPGKIGVDENRRYLYAFNLGITTNFD
jgi:hypothetical protein